MNLRTPEFYKDFKCIAGDCPDSCCQGWEVDADAQSLEYYKTLNGDIKTKIDSVLSKDEFGNTIFKLTDNKRCPFLNCENLCDMHIAIGGEHTPYTCRTFPRFINDFGSTRELGVSFSCPVAADMIFNLKEPSAFIVESNDLPPQLNDIDAQMYFFLLNARKKIYTQLCDENKTIIQKLNWLLDYSSKLQKELDNYDDGGDKIDFFDVFNNPELINPEWTQKVSRGCIKSVKDNVYNINIAIYFLFRYFLLAVYDNDVLSKAKMCVVGVLIATYFGEDAWTMHLWSKETEHSQYNMDRYKSLLKSADCLSVSNLKMLLSK